jgi:hypothetical protein
MVRYCLVILAGLGWAGSASAASWADAMFRELSKDFGTVPRGPMLTHPFHVVNNTGSPVHISGIRVSCGCVSATAMHGNLAVGQETVILAQMDSRRFTGVKTVTIYVQLDQPHSEEVRLWVQANSRDDVTVTPESLAFGQIKRSSAPSASVTITFLGNGQWQIVGAQCDSNYVQTTLKEQHRQATEVAYTLTAQLRSDSPVGKWYSDIWLKTNNAATPKIRVPLTVEIESALNISPTVLSLGQVKIGAQMERKVIVRGVKPFRVTDIKGADDILNVRDTTTDSRAVHVLTVTLKPQKQGDLNRILRVKTDLKDESEIEFQAKAQIMP